MIDFWASIWENLPDWGPQMLVAAVQTLKLTAASFVLAVAFDTFSKSRRRKA